MCLSAIAFHTRGLNTERYSEPQIRPGTAKTNPLLPQQPVRTIAKNLGCANLSCLLVRLQALFTRDLFMGLYSNHTCKHIDMWHLPGDALAYSRHQWNLASALSSLHASLFFVRGDYSPTLSAIGFSCPHQTWHPAPGSRLGHLVVLYQDHCPIWLPTPVLSSWGSRISPVLLASGCLWTP